MYSNIRRMVGEKQCTFADMDKSLQPQELTGVVIHLASNNLPPSLTIHRSTKASVTHLHIFYQDASSKEDEE